MSNTKRRIERQELTDRIAIINERIRTHLSQAQRADTHFDAYTHYEDIATMAKTAQSIVKQIEHIDTMPVQEQML
jgi:Trp operon repressor